MASWLVCLQGDILPSYSVYLIPQLLEKMLLQATLTKGHAREGSYINKSLLTLGTVIGKLSDGNAVHIPFRDSKLTRLLQSSMTGSAARISVIATATPASCQAEETHNTLKFATRAKKVGLVDPPLGVLDWHACSKMYCLVA